MSVIRKIDAFLKVVRAFNLLIIFLLFHILYYWYRKDFVTVYLAQMQPVFPYATLWLISLAVVCIAAAGYVINDYFDIKTDQINRPERVIAGVWYSRKELIFMNLVFNAAGIFLGFIAAFLSGHISLGIVYVASAVILLFYSSHLKKIVWVGNLIVAVLIGFLPFLFYLHLLSWYHIKWNPVTIPSLLILGKLFKVLALYGCFAFLINLIREMVKDMEDVEGDRMIDAKTIPVMYGIRSAIVFVFLFNVILFLLMAFVLYNLIRYSERIPVVFLSFLVLHVILNIITGILVLRSGKKEDFTRLSNWLKLIMLLGLVLPLVANI
jgi:4-hydroxybenzoate polyprenyltransferase